MLQLKIVSPEKVEYDGAAERILVPGTMGQFEILNDHAPIISTLQKGTVEYVWRSRVVSWKYRRIRSVSALNFSNAQDIRSNKNG